MHPSQNWGAPTRNDACATCNGEGEFGHDSEGGPEQCSDCFGTGVIQGCIPQIEKGPAEVGLDDQWYVVADTTDGSRYLHADGVWRCSTASASGVTGYFDTDGDAKRVLERKRM